MSVPNGLMRIGALVAVVLLGSWVGCTDQRTSESEANSEKFTHVTELSVTGLDGFDSMPWGTSNRELIQRKGMPEGLERTSLVDSVSEFEYAVDLFGSKARKTFEVHKNRGLISGSYAVPFPDPPTCRKVVQGFLERMKTRFSAPVPSPDQKADFDPCVLHNDEPTMESFLESFPYWQVRWKDSVTDTRAVLRISWIGRRGRPEAVLSIIHASHDTIYQPYLDSVSASAETGSTE